jgi:hypothetical protein
MYLWQQETMNPTFPYCNYGNKQKNEPALTTYCIYDNAKNR